MSKSRELKWHEKIFTGAISVAIGLTLLFNGFSYLTSLFISETGVEGGPTKQKTLVAFFSTFGRWLVEVPNCFCVFTHWLFGNPERS